VVDDIFDQRNLLYQFLVERDSSIEESISVSAPIKSTVQPCIDQTDLDRLNWSAMTVLKVSPS